MEQRSGHAAQASCVSRGGAATVVKAWMLLGALCVLAGCGGGGGGGGGGGVFPGIVPPSAVPPVSDGGAGSGTDGSGGSGGSGGGTTDPDAIVPSSTVAGLCVAPRAGLNPATGRAYPDRQGSLTDEKRWVRAWIDETYLWYTEVPTTLKAADYATPVAYFNVLKTPALTPSGRAKDRYHYVYDTERYRQLSEQGVSPSYGMEIAFVRSSPPRNIRIAFVEPLGPAAAAGLQRGARLVEVDGVNAVSATGTANVNIINRALSPQASGEKHTFTFEVAGVRGSPIELTSQSVTRTPVQNVRTIDTASGRVGYLLFNDHITTSEAQLINAVNQLQAAGVQDLVLDLRYNGGGQLNIASRLAYMVSGPASTNAKVFERLVFNDKNPFRLTPAQTIVPFYATSRTGAPLPRLGLSRVTVLAGPDTCSASESVINGLRGADVSVNLVGGKTCGKPYGFSPQDNCGTSYFAIQFQGVNNKNFGDYGDGFPPDCAIADDFAHQLGDPAEARLAAALHMQGGGACPAAAMTKALPGLEKPSEAEAEPYLRDRSPLREMRLLEPVPPPG